MSNQKALPKTKVVMIGEEEIVIKKLALGKYAQLLIALKGLPTGILTDLQNLDTEDQDQMFQMLFGTIAESWNQVLEVISIGSGISVERLATDEEIGGDVGFEIFKAIYEVNNLQTIVAQIKNAMNRPKA